MKTNFQITKGTDHNYDRCYRVSYVEFDTLYILPEPWYTRKAAEEKMRELKKYERDGEEMKND